MFDPQMELVSAVLERVLAAPDPGNVRATSWAEARRAVEAAGGLEPDLRASVAGEDHAALAAIVADWRSGRRHLPEHDREVLKRALKAYRKSFKVTRLDAESSIGGGPMSSGRKSGIIAIVPPARYPREVWDTLVRQGRLLDAGHGMYQLPQE